MMTARATGGFIGVAEWHHGDWRRAEIGSMQLTSGVPFLSDSEATLDEANVRPSVADAIVDENADARIDGLRAALAVLALLSILAVIAGRRLPKVQPNDPRFAESLVVPD